MKTNLRILFRGFIIWLIIKREFHKNGLLRKVRYLVLLKCKNIYPACKINEGLYYCSENYAGESKCNIWIIHLVHSQNTGKKC